MEIKRIITVTVLNEHGVLSRIVVYLQDADTISNHLPLHPFLIQIFQESQLPHKVIKRF